MVSVDGSAAMFGKVNEGGGGKTVESVPGFLPSGRGVCLW